MLTPFDLRDRIHEIEQTKKKLHHNDAIGKIKAKKETLQLYLTVMEEIAKGSLDPRSLAQEVLKLKIDV